MKSFNLLLVILLLAACTSTRITSSWKSADSTASKSLKKILVVAVMNDKDRRIREHMESHLVASLIDNGYDAISSMEEYGPKTFSKMSEEEVLRQLHSNEIDAVITISLLDKSRERSYVPGTVTYQPSYMMYNRFWPYYHAYYGRVYTPGYYTVNTKYFFETNLYGLNGTDKDLIYSAQSEAFDPASADEMAHGYAKAIIRDMKSKDLLAARK